MSIQRERNGNVCEFLQMHAINLGLAGKKLSTECLDYARYAVGKCSAEYEHSLRWNEKGKCYDYTHHSIKYTDSIGYTPYYIAFNGVSAMKGELPHTALLGYGDELESLQWTCCGVLISENFILTAAHCALNDIYGPVTYAALGLHKRDDPPETWQRYRVKNIIVHPEYRPPVKYHDIALLETEQRVKLNSLVIPGCLPAANQYVHDEASIEYEGQVAESTLVLTAAGWGALGFRKALANTLQVITVESVNETECLELYPPHAVTPHGYNKTTQLCFGNKYTHADTCEGGSGGPLQEKNPYCMYTILGVTSFGQACGFVSNAGIYTRVAHYVPWIEDIIWKDE